MRKVQTGFGIRPFGERLPTQSSEATRISDNAEDYDDHSHDDFSSLFQDAHAGSASYDGSFLQPDFFIASTPQRMSFRDRDGDRDPQRGRRDTLEVSYNDNDLEFSDLGSAHDEFSPRSNARGLARAQRWGLDDLLGGWVEQNDAERDDDDRRIRGSHRSILRKQISQSLLKQPQQSMGHIEAAEFRVDRAGMNLYHPGRKVCYYWNTLHSFLSERVVAGDINSRSSLQLRIEHCVLPRPAISLRGSLKHYLRVVDSIVRRVDRLRGLWHDDWAIEVVVNADECFPYHRQPGPRVGSLEVVFCWRNDEDAPGSWEQVVVFSKLESGQFCSASRLCEFVEHLVCHLREESELMTLQAVVRRLHASCFLRLLSCAATVLTASALRALTQSVVSPHISRAQSRLFVASRLLALFHRRAFLAQVQSSSPRPTRLLASLNDAKVLDDKLYAAAVIARFVRSALCRRHVIFHRTVPPAVSCSEWSLDGIPVYSPFSTSTIDGFAAVTPSLSLTSVASSPDQLRRTSIESLHEGHRSLFSGPWDHQLGTHTAASLLCAVLCRLVARGRWRETRELPQRVRRACVLWRESGTQSEERVATAATARHAWCRTRCAGKVLGACLQRQMARIWWAAFTRTVAPIRGLCSGSRSFMPLRREVRRVMLARRARTGYARLRTAAALVAKVQDAVLAMLEERERVREEQERQRLAFKLQQVVADTVAELGTKVEGLLVARHEKKAKRIRGRCVRFGSDRELEFRGEPDDSSHLGLARVSDPQVLQTPVSVDDVADPCQSAVSWCDPRQNVVETAQEEEDYSEEEFEEYDEDEEIDAGE